MKITENTEFLSVLTVIRYYDQLITNQLLYRLSHSSIYLSCLNILYQNSNKIKRFAHD